MDINNLLQGMDLGSMGNIMKGKALRVRFDIEG